jgi:hypothetical protein
MLINSVLRLISDLHHCKTPVVPGAFKVHYLLRLIMTLGSAQPVSAGVGAQGAQT